MAFQWLRAPLRYALATGYLLPPLARLVERLNVR
jgi:hypothetical protein